MNHIIKRQVLDLMLDHRLQAFDIQQRMRTLYFDEFLPALQKIFDELPGEDMVLSIDRLEVDLGQFDVNEMNDKSRIHQFIADIKEQLNAQFKLALAGTTENGERLPKMLSVFRQWLFYMQKGYLPWNIDGPTDLWYQLVLEALAVDYHSVDELRALLIAEPRVIRRIVMQHETDFLVHLVELFTAKRQAELPALIDAIYEVVRFERGRFGTNMIVADKREFETIVWNAIIQAVRFESVDLTSGEIVTHIIQSFFSSQQLRRALDAKELQHDISGILPALEGLVEKRGKAERESKVSFRHENKEGILDDEDVQQDVNGKQARKVGPYTNLSIRIFQDDQEDSSLASKDLVPELLVDKIEEGGVYVSNAGMVLLHPFLLRFFENLGLVAKGKFVDEARCCSAVFLLHYLCTGKNEAEEFELVIAKLLCGFSLADPVERSVQLSESQLVEAELIINELVQQWSILKSTSADGLREAFLQRRGKLYADGERLRLHVEASSIDVLLDYLPWNLSFIKLPWMKQPLQVDWRG